MAKSPDNHPLQWAPDRRARFEALRRCMLFIGLSVGLTLLTWVIARYVLKISIDVDRPLPLLVVLGANLALAIVSAVLPTAWMVATTREPPQTFGWGSCGRWRQLGLGIAAGGGLLSALLGAMSLLGGYSFGALALAPAAALEDGIAYLAVFALTAIAEEGAVRGYGLVQLSRAVSFWPAALIMSTVFLAIHLGHGNETPLGLAQVWLVGLVLAYSFLRSGALWFALGFHASWDYAQSFIYGVPDSGTSLTGTLLHPVFHGPTWLTGGSAGPEGSILVLPLLALLALGTHLAFPMRR